MTLSIWTVYERPLDWPQHYVARRTMSFRSISFSRATVMNASRKSLDARSAMLMAERLTRSVGCRIGTTRRVIVTDGGDSIVFEWRHGEGVTFPPAKA